MSLSLFSAIREKKKNGKKTGLVIFSVALIITLSLLAYTKMKYGSFV
jgi:hypothetical protein